MFRIRQLFFNNYNYYCLIFRQCSSSSNVQIDFSKLEPDKFGDLAAMKKFNNEKLSKLKYSLKSERLPNDPDGYDQLEIKRGIKISLEGYERIMSEIYRKRPRNLNKLLETYRSMVYEDRYRPNRNIYTMLVNACAHAGYTRKAFELYDEMKRYDYRPTRAMITALFNSSANCSSDNDRNYSLNKALELREELDSMGYHYNQRQYNVMIKTFALHNDQKNVDTTLKQMKLNRIEPNIDTYCMMMMGAIQHPKNGLLITTNLMKKIINQSKNITTMMNVAPFNLFLRSIRDCTIESEQEFLQIITNNNKNKQIINKKQQSPQSSLSIINKSPTNNNLLPNLLINNYQQQLSSIISIDFKSLDSVTNRFLLFGGVDGFLQIMDQCNVKPNLKTFTLMAELLSNNNDNDQIDCYEQIKNALNRYNCRADVCLYNVFIKIYAKRKNREKCEQMIREMQMERQQPDIMTFSALAFACNRTNDAKKFLTEMEQCLITPNNNIMGILINLACGHLDLTYIRFLLSYMQKNHLNLTIMDIERIEIMLNNFRQKILNADRINKPLSEKIRQSFDETKKQFRQMLKNTNIEINTNIWNQWQSFDHKPQNIKYQSSIRYMKKKIDLRKGNLLSNDKHCDIDSELNELDDDLS